MKNINLLPRRKFKKKVEIIRNYGDRLQVGDILESVTMVRGTYSGIKDGQKYHCPESYAKEIQPQ